MNYIYDDPTRCPRHPREVIRSDDGMFDAPCGACEYEMDAIEPHNCEATLTTDGYGAFCKTCGTTIS